MKRTGKLTRNQKAWIFAVVFAVLILSSAFLLFYKLDVHYMHYYDEHFYGLNAYEMIRNDDYIVHTYMGAVNDNNTKPPLGLWAIALSYRLFGFSLFSMRAQSALLMLLSQIILGLWARKRFGALAGLTAMAMLIGTQAVYGFHFARFGDLDALYQFWFMLAMLCMIDSKRDFRRLYLSAAFCGFAYLTKSWHAFAIAVTVAVYLLAAGRIRELTLRRIMLLAASFLAVVLPWAAVRIARDGFTLFEQSVGIQVAGTIRITNDPSVPNRNVLGYLYYLVRQPHFDGALLIAAFCAAVLFFRRRRSPGGAAVSLDWNAVLGCTAWMFVTPLLLSFTEKKLDWYVFSSLYGAALLTGIMVQALQQNHAGVWARAAAITAVAALFLYGAGSSFMEINKLEYNEPYRQAMEDALDRDVDSGLHAYVQYSERQDGAFITAWTATDYLYAELYGDVDCLPGGADAFLADGDPAILFIGKPGQTAEIEALYLDSICLADEASVCVFSN